jgi:hypothetical protein
MVRTTGFIDKDDLRLTAEFARQASTSLADPMRKDDVRFPRFPV